MMDERAIAVPKVGPRRRRNLCAQVVEELGSRIVSGELNGETLFPKEADLEREFNVSRSVIREAIKSLAAKGMLESRTRTGIRALPPTRWNLFDAEVLSWRSAVLPPGQFFGELFEVRLMIEPQAAALAAERATTDDLAHLKQAFEEMIQANQASTSGVEADLRFHQSILAASKNQLLLQIGHLIGVGLQISHRFDPDSFTIFLSMHEKVMLHIQERNREAARCAMEQLLRETLVHIRGYFPKNSTK